MIFKECIQNIAGKTEGKISLVKRGVIGKKHFIGSYNIKLDVGK